MSDAINIATLKDSKSKIESLIEKIKANLKKFDNLEPSEQTRLTNIIYSDFKYANSELDSMKNEVKLLKTEQTEKAFKDHIQTLKAEIKKLQEDFTDKQNQKKDLGGLLLDDIQIKEKRNDEMNILELKSKGDRILKEDDDAIKRIDKKVLNQLEIADAIKQDLHKQNQKLENTQKDLKEIDYSLARAKKQLVTMFKMYATDKIIMCLIVIIVLVILAIIITAAVGGDKNNSFNVPHNIFSDNQQSTTSTTAQAQTKTRVLFLQGLQ
jgi:DNA repair exonuclease SbcCD ATPase subunit